MNMLRSGETVHYASRREAFAGLDEAPLSCVTWDEKAVKMSAIYWNGKRRVQPADKKRNWSKLK